MTIYNLQEWIKHPEILNRDTLYEIRILLARYPYFQTLRLLLLKNLYLLHDTEFTTELKRGILFIADRRVLFTLIEGDFSSVEFHSDMDVVKRKLLSSEPIVDRTLSLIDAFLISSPAQEPVPGKIDYANDYISYLLQQPDVVGEQTEEVVPLHNQALIDKFLENDKKMPAFQMLSLNEESVLTESNASPEVIDDTVSETKTDIHSASSSTEYFPEINEENSCFTETLAKIYVKQHRYVKALEIIKKLSIKYPKKNAYFADQIRFLEKLIINNKTK
ncbi:MAG: tetratricopeptide repeat protein [Bacteroidaceae bacterium]|nr:tetratricopeptide repeat protein [Bacteroidaceae bacterium]